MINITKYLSKLCRNIHIFQPEILEWVGYDHILTSSLIEVSNVAGSTALECYQLYDKALNMMEMFVTRDKCIRDGR